MKKRTWLVGVAVVLALAGGAVITRDVWNPQGAVAQANLDLTFQVLHALAGSGVPGVRRRGGPAVGGFQALPEGGDPIQQPARVGHRPPARPAHARR